jgi:hypothetical protein
MNNKKNKTWTEWLESLEPQEASVLLLKLKKLHAKKQQRIFNQGDCDSRLIFVQSGKLKLCYWDSVKKKNIMFTDLSRGDVCGAESFFSLSPQTGTLSAVEDSIILCLYKDDFQKILDAHPAFEKKLVEYCNTCQKKIVFHEPEKLARRAYPRHPVSLNGRIHPLDPSLVKFPELNVTVSDISIGGARCKTKNLRAQDAEKFYQRPVKIKIFYQKNFLPCDIEKLAKVVAVRFPSSGGATIHIEFQVPLTEKEVLKMVQDKNIYTYS